MRGVIRATSYRLPPWSSPTVPTGQVAAGLLATGGGTLPLALRAAVRRPGIVRRINQQQIALFLDYLRRCKTAQEVKLRRLGEKVAADDGRLPWVEIWNWASC